MSKKPIFVATHPRACSTAFERVFMTRRDVLKCAHEPFGDAYYFGPERLGARYEQDEAARLESGFGESTFNTIMERINKDNTEGKRLFIKDMAQYFVPPNKKPVSLAPSLLEPKHGVGTNSSTNGSSNGVKSDHIRSAVPLPRDEDLVHQPANAPYSTPAEVNNPTVMPTELMKQFHFAFLIRHPRRSIPSYYRCTIPPLDEVTGFYDFRPEEAGYDELRRMFDYLRQIGQVGPEVTGQNSNGSNGSTGAGVKICVVDADDLLDNPARIIETFCDSVGIDYCPEMLDWNNEKDQKQAVEAFEKWKGFHEDAIHSKDLKPRTQAHKSKTDDEYYEEWLEKYGEDGAKIIKQTVHDNLADYEYLKSFAMKV